MSIAEQTQIFIIFVIVGIIISFLFDIFRILRKVYKFSNMLIYMQDILFWLLTGIIILQAIFKFNSGDIRIFLFLGIFVGVFIYISLFSIYVIKIGSFILKLINTLIRKLINVFKVPICKILNFMVKYYRNLRKNVLKKLKST